MADSEDEYLASVNNWITSHANVYAEKIQATERPRAAVPERMRSSVKPVSSQTRNLFEKKNVKADSAAFLPIEQVSLHISSSSVSFTSPNNSSVLQRSSNRDQSRQTTTEAPQLDGEVNQEPEDPVERQRLIQSIAEQLIGRLPETTVLEPTEVENAAQVEAQVASPPAVRRPSTPMYRPPSVVERPPSPIPQTPSPVVPRSQRPVSRTRSTTSTRHVLAPSAAPQRNRRNAPPTVRQSTDFAANRRPPANVLATMYPRPIGTGWLPPYQTPPPPRSPPPGPTVAQIQRQPQHQTQHREMQGSRTRNFIEPFCDGDAVTPQLEERVGLVPFATHSLQLPSPSAPLKDQTTWIEDSVEDGRRAPASECFLDATEPIVASSSHFESARNETVTPRQDFPPMFANLTRHTNNPPSARTTPLPPPQQQPPPPPPQHPTSSISTMRPLSHGLLRNTLKTTTSANALPLHIGQNRTNPTPPVQAQQTAVQPTNQRVLPPQRIVQNTNLPPQPPMNNNQVAPASLPMIPAASVAPPAQRGFQSTNQLFRTIQNLPEVTIDITSDTWDLHNSTFAADNILPTRRVAPEPVRRGPTPPQMPRSTLSNSTEELSPEQLALNARMQAVASDLATLTPSSCDRMSEVEIVALGEALYFGSPRQKFKEAYPFITEGVLQKDSQIANQLKVYSSRVGQIYMPDRADRGNHDYVWFMVVREGVYRGISFGPHPKSLVSAKFPSEDRIVLRGYALLGHAVSKNQSRTMTEGRWICWNDSMGVLSIASGAARTSMKKQPIWDKQLDVVSVQANYERNRFVVLNVVALTNLEEKKRMFPEDVFLVEDMIYREREGDDLIFSSAALGLIVSLKARLAENLKGDIQENRQYQIVTAPAFRSSTRLEFRGILIIDDPNTFWCTDKEWVRDKLIIQTAKYKQDTGRF